MEEKKSKRVFEIVSLIIEALLVFILSFFAIRSCASTYTNGVEDKSTPSLVYREEKKEALLSPIENNDRVIINNYTGRNISFVYQNSNASVSYYSHSISNGESYLAYYNAGSTDKFYFYDDDGYSYFLSDDSNINCYSDEFNYAVENFNGTYINIYSDFESRQPLYLDTSFDMRLEAMKPFVLNELPNTSVKKTYGYTIDLGSSFSLDFTDDYINYFNVFNRLLLEYFIIPSDYGFKWYADLYAYGTNHNQVTHVLLATTRVFDNPQIGGFDNARFGLNVFGDNWFKGNNFLLAPYLDSSKLTPIGNSFSFVNGNASNGNVLIRPLLLQNAPFKENRIVLVDLSSGDVHLWADFGDLLLVVLLSVLPIANIRILPFITIGALIIAPILVMLVMFILRLFKK